MLRRRPRLSFSHRLAWQAGPNPLARAVAARRAAGDPILDLTVSNPTAVGLEHPPRALQAALRRAGVGRYRPEAQGLRAARAAVVNYYRDKGCTLMPEQLFLTASTSEAYGHLFKLLADPGDAVLAPAPSYPLFEFLAHLEGIELRSYRLQLGRMGRWSIDLAGLEAAAADRRVRAVVVVSPNNPTGSCLRAGELEALNALCRRRGLALLVDEVFSDYAGASGVDAGATTAGNHGALTFVLSGLSKVAGLPQMKLGWIAVSGPERLRQRASAALELIADSYLSVSTPVQLAAARLLALRHDFQRRLQARLRRNLRSLARALADSRQLRPLPHEAGWSAVLQSGVGRGDEALVLRLLEQTGVLVHPGYFYDFEQEGMLVLSLLTPPAVFERGVRRMAACLG
jgi:hypothetical protein